MLEINLQPFPVLSTERLLLRQITPYDASAIFKLQSNTQVMHYIDRPLLKEEKEAVEKIKFFDELLKKTEAINWAITLKESENLIGLILLKNIDASNHRAEVGYMLHPAFWRKGIVQEALTAVLDYSFYTLNLHTMEAVINPENEASETLLKKNGFVKEAHFRENYYFDGKFLDSGVYSLLKSNYNNNKQ